MIPSAVTSAAMTSAAVTPAAMTSAAVTAAALMHPNFRSDVQPVCVALSASLFRTVNQCVSQCQPVCFVLSTSVFRTVNQCERPLDFNHAFLVSHRTSHIFTLSDFERTVCFALSTGVKPVSQWAGGTVCHHQQQQRHEHHGNDDKHD